MLLAALALAAAGAANDSARPLDQYLALVQRYRTGAHPEAVTELLGWPTTRIRNATDELRRHRALLRARPVLPGEIDFRLAEAAVLLHAAVGLQSLRVGGEATAQMHLGLATDLLDWSLSAAKAREDTPPNSLLEGILENRVPSPRPNESLQPRLSGRDLYVVLGAACLALGSPEIAVKYTSGAVRIAPADAEALLLDGCAAEVRAHLWRRAEKPLTLRALAERRFRGALTAEPTLFEASLRLGHVLLVDDRPSEALPLLQDVADHSLERRQRYLARLLLARALARQGNTRAAADTFTKALQDQPDGVAARLGLASLLERAAGAGAARPLVLEALSRNGRSDHDADPWALYFFGTGQAQGLAASLWDRVLGP